MTNSQDPRVRHAMGNAESASHARTPFWIATLVAIAAVACGCGSSSSGGGDGQVVVSGSTTSIDAITWSVDHTSETPPEVAGAEVTSSGALDPFGPFVITTSSAWNWAVPASGVSVPLGPTTAYSATVLGGLDYPHAFTSQPVSATGAVTIEFPGLGTLFGTVTGGEIYELAVVIPGDGQESFFTIEITGGTGAFDGATGSLTSHSVIDYLGGGLVSNELEGVMSLRVDPFGS